MSEQVFTQSAEALGTTVVLQLVLGSQQEAESLFTQLWSYIENFEKRFSRFLPDSELTQVNLAAGQRVIVSEEFATLAERSRELGMRTYGIYNPFMLPAVQKAGYVRSIHERTAAQPPIDYSDREVGEIENLEVGAGWVKIPPHTALDFGGIGKGFLADQLRSLCRQLPGYCLSIGGDMAVAGLPPGRSSWGVRIEDVHDRTKDIAEVVTNTVQYGVATSGQKRVKDGVDVTHSIDAITSEVIQSNVLSATVVAPDATTADVYAGVVLQLKDRESERLCKDGTLYAVIQQLNDGNVQIFGDGIMTKKASGDS